MALLWAVMGGRFVRHPKLQRFTVTVKDRTHPATKGLPPTFEWEDECYVFDRINPSIKVLLTTDPSKIDDPKRTEHADARSIRCPGTTPTMAGVSTTSRWAIKRSITRSPLFTSATFGRNFVGDGREGEARERLVDASVQRDISAAPSPHTAEFLDMGECSGYLSTAPGPALYAARASLTGSGLSLYRSKSWRRYLAPASAFCNGSCGLAPSSVAVAGMSCINPIAPLGEIAFVR